MKKKVWLIAAIAAVLFLSIAYFWHLFIKQGYNLNFTNEDNLILFLFVVMSLLTFLSVVWLVIDRNKIYKILTVILEDIASSEDNMVKLQRETQLLIMNLADKFDVGGTESEKLIETKGKMVRKK